MCPLILPLPTYCIILLNFYGIGDDSQIQVPRCTTVTAISQIFILLTFSPSQKVRPKGSSYIFLYIFSFSWYLRRASCNTLMDEHLPFDTLECMHFCMPTQSPMYMLHFSAPGTIIAIYVNKQDNITSNIKPHVTTKISIILLIETAIFKLCPRMLCKNSWINFTISLLCLMFLGHQRICTHQNVHRKHILP